MCAFNITLREQPWCEQLVVGYALRISTDYLLSKAFTIKYYAPPLASNVLHHQWPRITTVDNNTAVEFSFSSRFALRCSQPSLNFLKNRWRPKGNVSLSSIYSLLFFIVSCNGRGGTPPLSIGSCGVPGGGLRIGSQIMSLSKITATSPFLTPTNTYADYARVLPILNLEPVFNEISKGKKRQKYNVTKKARLQDQVTFPQLSSAHL
jgi:hypothetical protein